jgi:hypothetical protein
VDPAAGDEHLKDGVQAVRANFAAINYGTNARPLGDDNDQCDHRQRRRRLRADPARRSPMDAVLNEFDFWALVTGNAWLHTYVENDRKNGIVDIQTRRASRAEETSPVLTIAQAGRSARVRGQRSSSRRSPTDRRRSTKQALTEGRHDALSPFEIAFPMVYERFDTRAVLYPAAVAGQDVLRADATRCSSTPDAELREDAARTDDADFQDAAVPERSRGSRRRTSRPAARTRSGRRSWSTTSGSSRARTSPKVR